MTDGKSGVLAEKGILTREQLTIELKLQPQTLRLWERAGMPVIRRGKVILYSVDDVIDWMKKNPGKPRRKAA